jgi:surface antigen
MRAPLIVGLFACVAIAASQGGTAKAESLDSIISKSTDTTQNQNIILALNTKVQGAGAEDASAKKEEIKPPVEHIVVAGDTLTSISEKYQSDWHRLFNKNTQLQSPDILMVGEKLVIPNADEQLAERPLPAAQVAVPQPAATPRSAAQATTASAYRGSSAGNTYTPGYCTWYAKNMRPDLPNNLGNADTWVYRAAAQGIPTGGAPRVGAIGQQGMHVVYVERVNSDGTVFISEMNYQGLYIRSTRTVPASYFTYIY